MAASSEASFCTPRFLLRSAGAAGPRLEGMRTIPLAVLCLISTPAVAGDWNAVGAIEKGHPVCGLSLSVEGRRFELRHTVGAETFTVGLGRPDWRVAKDAAHEALLRFDGHAPWVATLRRGSFTFPVESLGQFILEFRDSNTFTVLVRVEPPTGWAASLVGSGVAGDAFLECARQLF